MRNFNSKTNCSNTAQILYLCRYMQKHPQFAADEYSDPLGSAKYNAEWDKLKGDLDELGPLQSVEQWKICWRDQYRKCSVPGEIKQTTNAAGNIEIASELINTTSLVLDATGSNSAAGNGPAESLDDCFQNAIQPLAAQQTVMQYPAPKSAMLQSRNIRFVQAQQRKRRRIQRNPPHNHLLNAQLERNSLIKELITELRRSNRLKEEHLNLLRGAHPD